MRVPIKAEKYSDYWVSLTPNPCFFEEDVHTLKFDVRAMSRSKDEIERSMRKVVESIFQRQSSKLPLINEKAGYLFTHPEEKSSGNSGSP